MAKNVRTYKRPRATPGTNVGRRSKNRMVARVIQQIANSVENKMHYQAGREWASFQTDGMVTKRRIDIRKAINVDFVEGVVFKGRSIWDQ